MLPRWHILFGALFSIFVFIMFPETNFIYLLLLFLSSFLIDFDHYIVAVRKTGSLSLFRAFEYHEKAGRIADREHARGLRNKGDFHLFHTVEFIIFVGLLGLLWVGFFYIFIGMVFHSLLDLTSLICSERVYRRTFFLIESKRNYFGVASCGIPNLSLTSHSIASLNVTNCSEETV